MLHKAARHMKSAIQVVKAIKTGRIIRTMHWPIRPHITSPLSKPHLLRPLLLLPKRPHLPHRHQLPNHTKIIPQIIRPLRIENRNPHLPPPQHRRTMNEQPSHGNAIRAGKQRFPFLTAQIKRNAILPRHIRRSAAGLEDFEHERFGDTVGDAFDGVVAQGAEILVVFDEVPGMPDEVGELAHAGEVLGNVLGRDGGIPG